jgi:resuscitation-promoting factor RpfA
MTWLTAVRYKGKHRALNNNDHRTTMTLALVLGAGLSSVSYGDASADPPGGWDSIIACESGGKNIHTAIPGPFTASGFFQITNGTWARNGGLKFAPTAMQATFAEQKIVANTIFARNPSLSDWAASRSCWASGKKRATIQESSSPTKPRAVSPAKAVPAPAKPKPSPAVARVTPAPRITGKVHIVRRGETLSRIAGLHWRTLYQLNKRLIGNNPNRIFPGQRLVLA